MYSIVKTFDFDELKDYDVHSLFKAVSKRFGKEFTFLLESIPDKGSGHLFKRYSELSIIAADPVVRFSRQDGNVTIESSVSEIPSEEFSAEELKTLKSPLEKISQLLKKSGSVSPFLRFTFAALGYAGYDYVRNLEKIGTAPKDEIGIPEFFFVFHRTVAIIDHLHSTITFIHHVFEGQENSFEALVKDLVAAAKSIHSSGIKDSPVNPSPGSTVSSIDYPEFSEKFKVVKEHIKNGDVFQLVLSRRFTVESSRDPYSVYSTLRKTNPSPYMFYLDFGDFQLLGSSPEMHVRMTNRMAEIRPIAGTRKRGKDSSEDDLLIKDLLSDSKELAEHTMLIDLARNDLGRICVPGSVEVPEKYIVEKYSHVMHIVSHVVGRLRDGYSSVDLLNSTFPAGTVAGAPKVRAMQIINGLEPVSRSFYAGVVGYFDINDNCDFCISIRCCVRKGKNYYCQAGAGIVLDSDCQKEFQEIGQKAKAILDAVG